KKASSPVKGGELSKLYNVSRQVIVQDIALLRAEGHDIIATPQGYILMTNNNGYIRKIIAVKHDENQIEEELRTIVGLGGRIIDVTIEHKIYGEITGKLMLKSIYDVEMFINKLKDSNAKPLSNLTEGVHIHTIEVDSENDMERILKALKEKGFLIE
ncbi:transcription repressor NadR, partial [Thermobrachium celere]|uniref:transcription repressor NadR n=1 Tax=Thermobrachium celere TaxID=53422 RepID=UPI0019424BBF